MAVAVPPPTDAELDTLFSNKRYDPITPALVDYSQRWLDFHQAVINARGNRNEVETIQRNMQNLDRTINIDLKEDYRSRVSAVMSMMIPASDLGNARDDLHSDSVNALVILVPYLRRRVVGGRRKGRKSSKRKHRKSKTAKRRVRR
jgi:hypothetical protein